MHVQLGEAWGEMQPSNEVLGSIVAVAIGPKALVSKVGAPKGIGPKAWEPDRVRGICAFASSGTFRVDGLAVARRISLVKAALLGLTAFDEGQVTQMSSPSPLEPLYIGHVISTCHVEINVDVA